VLRIITFILICIYLISILILMDAIDFIRITIKVKYLKISCEECDLKIKRKIYRVSICLVIIAILFLVYLMTL